MLVTRHLSLVTVLARHSSLFLPGGAFRGQKGTTRTPSKLVYARYVYGLAVNVSGCERFEVPFDFVQRPCKCGFIQT